MKKEQKTLPGYLIGAMDYSPAGVIEGRCCFP